MSWRTIMALAASALVLLAYLVVRDMVAGDAADGSVAGRIFPGLRAGEAREVRWTVGGATLKILRGEVSRWRMEAPYPDRADGVAVERLLSLLEFAEPLRILGDGDAPDGAGLAKPSVRLTLISQGGRHEAEFGAADASGQGVYARIWRGESRDGARLLVAPANLLAALRQEASTWRDHQLVPMTPGGVRRIQFSGEAGEWSLERSGTGWIVKAGEHRARAGDTRGRRLLAALLTLRATRLLSRAADAKGKPSPWILCQDDGGRRVELSLWGACPGRADQLLVVAAEAPSGRRALGCVDRAQVAALSPAPGVLLDRRLTRRSEAELTRIMVHMETRTALLERRTKGWVMLGEEEAETAVEAGVVSALVQGLAALEGELQPGAERGLQRAVVTLEDAGGTKEILTFRDRRGGGLLVKRASTDRAVLGVPASALRLVDAALKACGVK